MSCPIRDCRIADRNSHLSAKKVRQEPLTRAYLLSPDSDVASYCPLGLMAARSLQTMSSLAEELINASAVWLVRTDSGAVATHRRGRRSAWHLPAFEGWIVMILRTLVLAALLLGSGAFCSEPTNDDTVRLEGTWGLQALEINGKKAPSRTSRPGKCRRPGW
jgi:hypothetical protein